jgi:hypothetical protein
MEWQQAPLVDLLKIKLDDAKKKELNSWIDHKKESIKQSRSQFFERQKIYLPNYDDFVTHVRKGPWDGSSNFHMPLTLVMVNAQIAKFYNILSSSEMVNLVPREGTDETFTKAMTRLRDWYLNDYINEYDGIKTFTWEVCFDTVTVGFGLGFRNWLMKQRKVMDYQPNQINELNREMADMAPLVADISKSVKQPSDIPEKKIDISIYKEVEKVVTAFEGTRLQTVDFTRAWFSNSLPGVNNMDHLDMVLLQDDTTLSEIKIKENSEEYFKGSFEEAKKEKKQQNSTETDIQDQKDHLTGYETDLNYSDKERVLEHVFCDYDIDDDGIDEQLVITRTEKGTILKATYLNRISPSGRRPIYKFDCFPKSRTAYSRGVPEYMYQLNEKMDLNENMKQDYMQINLAPMFAYRSSSSLDSKKIRLSPAKGIPVDDVNQDIRILSFNTSMGSLFQDQALDWQMADRMMSTSALAQGQIAGAVGAQRSTSGILTLLKQMDYELIPRFQVLANQWKKLQKDLLEDLDFRVDPALKQRVLGPDVEKAFESRSDFNQIFRLSASLDMKIDVVSIVNSEEMRKNDAAIIYQNLSTPGIAHQFGIIGPKAVHQSLSDWLKLYGRDPEKYLQKPQFTEDPLTVWQELMVCAQGEMPLMNMMDDHEKKAADLEAFLKSGEWAPSVQKGFYVSNFVDVVGQTIKKHLALAQALVAQAPNLAQGQQSNFNQLMTGTAPQQGGQNENFTTSRDLGGARGVQGSEASGAEGASPEVA